MTLTQFLPFHFKFSRLILYSKDSKVTTTHLHIAYNVFTDFYHASTNVLSLFSFCHILEFKQIINSPVAYFLIYILVTGCYQFCLFVNSHRVGIVTENIDNDCLCEHTAQRLLKMNIFENG